MTKLLLALHVVAAILAIGPVAVAASMFPAVLRRAEAPAGGAPADAGGDRAGTGGDRAATLRLLHRLCRVYTGVGAAVPVLGFATASALGVLGSPWLITSIALTTIAAAILWVLILPAQETALEGAAPPGGPSRLAMLTGIFNLLWVAVTVLMIVRPGSTTGT
ncbi:hypothetical protein C6N75_29300 [Streptomyces solincola]|uniref:DUF2269 family protein n=1 Tax=Streptomyces solincola TaxID=2100817 RepID=A0A2S9PMX8_9ACTN|nr:hypothetical protein [Streptomyces solincola]PRH75748.1 hypothetical protein C6N75_29300 [Streptomyces solincola]